MNILTIDNITKSYGVRKIFDGASFFLQESLVLTEPENPLC
mgnify:CR=1 FL=1